MKLSAQLPIFNLVKKEHLYKNDFFLRCLQFELSADEQPTQLVFYARSNNRTLLSRCYHTQELALRLKQGQEECLRYRDSSLPRILGLSHRPSCAFMDEHFSFYTSEPIQQLLIEAYSSQGISSVTVPIEQYHSPNRYLFPLRGCYMVSDTYTSINSHRWCRNSEFAFDVGNVNPFSGGLTGACVYAVGEGEVVEVFDGLEDTDERTSLDEIEQNYSEHERIDGNHVLIRHPSGEYSLYAHLLKGSIRVRCNDRVDSHTLIGKTGSSGNSRIPHLHFHMMLDGIHGPGIPVRFENLFTHFDEPCLLDDPVNIVYTK